MSTNAATLKHDVAAMETVYQRISTAVAFHEAGHCAIDVALGNTPLRATVVVKPGRKIVAFVESAGIKPISILDGCCGLLAGYFAEVRHSGGQSFCDDVANSDFTKVDAILPCPAFLTNLRSKC